MWWKKKSQQTSTVADDAKKADCQHQGRFLICGNNTASPPKGTCQDCGAEVPLDFVLNTYIQKLDRILDAHGVK
jgi:hypothetical protein